jgi:hypothetical protein
VLGGVAGIAILQKVRAAVDVHELQQVVFQHCPKALAIYGCIFGKWYSPPCPTKPEKQPQTITLSECLTVFMVYLLSNLLVLSGLCILALEALMHWNVN